MPNDTLGEGFSDGVRVSDSPEGVAKAKKARELLKRGDWKNARVLYSQLTDQFPEDTELRRHVLLNAFRQQDYEEVVKQSLQLADIALLYDDTTSALERYSEILRLPELVAGDHGQAVGERVSGLVEPLKAGIYFTYGDHYLAVGKPEMALQYFEVSERLEPGRWETSWGAGQAYLMMGDKTRAIKALYSSVNTAPSDAASAYETLGEVLLSEGRPPEKVREMFYRASVVFEKYECFEEALRVTMRWLQLHSQDKQMAERARKLKQLLSR